VTFDLLSGIIALLVSYYAFQARRCIERRVLNAISFGFSSAPPCWWRW
jgi:hypothetical protein